MRAFNDSEGRPWAIAVNVDSVKRVRDLTGVDLVSAIEGKLLGDLSNDPIKMVDVVFALLKPEADGKGVSDESFGRVMGGDSLDAAWQALLEEIVSFFRSGRREVLTKAIQKMETAERKILAKISSVMDDGRLERALEAQLSELGKPSTSAPESLAATLDL